jgi:hypothetical protein
MDTLPRKAPHPLFQYAIRRTCTILNPLAGGLLSGGWSGLVMQLTPLQALTFITKAKKNVD